MSLPQSSPGLGYVGVPGEGLSRSVFRKGESSGSCWLSPEAGGLVQLQAEQRGVVGAAPLPCCCLFDRGVLLRVGAEMCYCAWPLPGFFLCQPPSPAQTYVKEQATLHALPGVITLGRVCPQP